MSLSASLNSSKDIVASRAVTRQRHDASGAFRIAQPRTNRFTTSVGNLCFARTLLETVRPDLAASVALRTAWAGVSCRANLNTMAPTAITSPANPIRWNIRRRRIREAAQPPRPSSRLLEDTVRIYERRPDDHDEHDGEDEDDDREEHLHRGLHRLLLCDHLASVAEIVRLCSHDPGERNSLLLRLDHGVDERRHLVSGNTLRQAPECADTTLPHTHLAQHHAKLLADRTVRALDDVRQGRVEAQPGLHRDRDLVDDAG